MHRKGAFSFSKRSLPLLLQARGTSPHPPTLIFTGATASIKGSANFAAFASAKFALRALAQSLAREFGPQGIHVSHTIIDGIIDIPRTKAYTVAHEDGKLSPDAVGFPHYHLFEFDRMLTYLPDCGFLLASAYPATHDVCF